MSKFKIQMLSIFLLPLMAMPQPVEEKAEIREPLHWDNPAPTEVIERYASQYGANPDIVRRVMMCESGGNKDAINRNEPNKVLSVGIMQFQPHSFKYMAEKFGEELDYYSYHDQIKLASWAIANGMGRNWTCFRKIV